ncbi:MAG: flagellar biosynthetic protein FliR [Janthinobacterium lividum]
MFDLAAFSANSFWAFLQIFVRVSALFVTAPVFGAKEIPSQVKVGLAAIISLVLLPLVKTTLTNTVPGTVFGMAGVILGQALIGLMIGFVVSLLFVAVRMGGDLIDYQMGFTQAATFNPQFNETVSPIANFQYQYALVLYLIANGHWLLLASLERSFIRLPVSQLSITGLTGAFTDITFQMLVAGLQIAAPAAAVLMVTDIAFAFLNRAMPSMQVFYVGMPLKVLVGFVVVIAALPLLSAVVGQMAAGSPDQIAFLLKGMHK